MKRSPVLIALLVLVVVGAAWFVTIGADTVPMDGRSETPAEASKRTRQRARNPGDPVAEGSEEPQEALDEDAALRGRVITGEDSTPVPGARIAVFPVRLSSATERLLHEHGQLRTAGEGFPNSPVVTASASADGRFALQTPGAGLHHILVTAAGFAPRAAYHRTGDDALDVALVRANEVRIRTVDLLGAGVSGAALHRMPGNSTAPVAVVIHTDEYGRAAMRLGEGDRVVVRASGFAPLTWRPEELSTTERVLTLEPGRSLKGRVVDPDGQPVADAIVRLGSAEEVGPQITDAGGKFVFDHALSMIASSFPGVEVTAKGFHPGSGVMEEGGESVLVRLSRPVRITGQVLDPDGGPVGDAEVIWAGGGRPTQAQADATGRYSLEVAARTTGVLHAVVERDDPSLGHPVRWAGVQDVAVADAEVSVDLVLDRSKHAYLSLRALSPDGTPLEDVGIIVFRPADTLGPKARTNAEGYALVVLAEPSEPRFRVHLEVPDPFVQPEDRWVPVSATPDGPATDLTVRTATPITLVFVGEDGVPIDGERWQPQYADPRSGDMRVEDGAIVRVLHLVAPERVSGVIPGIGRYAVHVDPAATPGGRLTVPIARGATISGRVTVEGGGVPEGRLSLSVDPTGGGPGSYPDQRIGADGRFEFTGLPSGTYSLMVLTPETTILAMRTGTLAHGQTLDLGQVSADPSQWVTVTLIDVAGKPAVGADVNYIYSPRWESLGWEVANERGEVRGPPAPGSRLILHVNAGERGVALVHAADDFPERRIRLVPPTVLNVRVEGAEAFDQWVDVHVRLPGLDEWIEHDGIVWPEDNEGVTRVLALAPCDVRVRITYEDAEGKEWRAERELTVGAGRKKDLTIAPKRVESSD